MKYILVILLLLLLPSCTAAAPPPDVPSYTADQVITIVRAKYPSAYARGRYIPGERIGGERIPIPNAKGYFTQYYYTQGHYTSDLLTPTSISVRYMNDGKWSVTISAPPRFYLERRGSGITEINLTFHESDGSLLIDQQAKREDARQRALDEERLRRNEENIRRSLRETQQQ